MIAVIDNYDSSPTPRAVPGHARGECTCADDAITVKEVEKL